MKNIRYIASLFLIITLFAPLRFHGRCCAEIYKYRDKNGQWCFTNDPSILPELKGAEVEHSLGIESQGDLEKRLAERSPPKNAIEEARNATVAIKSSIGVGSGFFITPAGHILTNRHLLEAGENTCLKIEDLEKKLNEIKSRLEKEHSLIQQEKKNLAQGTRNREYDETRRQLKIWTRDYESRRAAFEKKREELEDVRQKSSYPYGLKIILVDGTEFSVSVLSMSDSYDLALLKLEGYKTPFIKPGNLDRVSHGDPLYAIGTPVGLNLRHTVTSGIFSGLRVSRTGKYIQTNAQINPGNSGGPLINEEGTVLGINTLKQRDAEGIGLAIPIKVALETFENFVKKLEPN